jgi:hypothetical protein
VVVVCACVCVGGLAFGTSRYCGAAGHLEVGPCGVCAGGEAVVLLLAHLRVWLWCVDTVVVARGCKWIES